MGELCKEYVPKTVEDEVLVEQRKQATSEQLFSKLKSRLNEALVEFPSDEFLNDLLKKIGGKTHKSFKKPVLVDISLTFDHHLNDLLSDRDFLMYIPENVN